MSSTIEMIAKQQYAKALYMEGNRTNGEIAAIVGVSAVAMSEWSKKFNWKVTREFRLKREALLRELESVDTDFVLNGFCEFMAAKNPSLKIQWGMLVDEYKEYLNPKDGLNIF